MHTRASICAVIFCASAWKQTFLRKRRCERAHICCRATKKPAQHVCSCGDSLVAGQRASTQAALLFDDEGEGRGTNWRRRCHHLSCWLLRNGGAAQNRDPCCWQTCLRVLRWQNFAGEAGQFCGDGCAGDAVCCTAVLHAACTACVGQLPAVVRFGLRADHACMPCTHRCLWPVPRRVRR